MGMVGKLFERWAERNNQALMLSVGYQKRSSGLAAWSKFVRYTQQSLVLGTGALLVIRGELSPGAMIAANVLMSRALAPIDLMVSTWGSFLTFKESFNRLGDLLQTYPMDSKPLKNVEPKGGLVLKDVVATAPGRELPILRDVSMIIPVGSITVVLGASGSGKSTLAKVMLGVWPTESGQVLLDGESVGSWHRTELGPNIGYLPQDIELFEGTIAQNIARSGPVKPQQVIEAATACGLHETILRMPRGYDSHMGEASGLLSGGQRQRVALARALYGSPALVVLDEPNANLDDEGEAALAKAIEGLKAQGKAVVLITHRPAAVAMADRILILQEGAVQASGPRDQVFAAIKAQQEQQSGHSGHLKPT
jgi:ATP-binding cassette subfamily C exporter for protease/lipase